MALLFRVLFVASFILPICFGAGSNILFGNLAATLVPQPAPHNPILTLAPLNINDPNQQWIINSPNGTIASANPAYTNETWNINGASKAEHAKIILYPVGTGKNLNQLWTISNGVIYSPSAVNFTVAPNGTSNLYMTYSNTPAVATVQTAESAPWYCSSVGDPHISPYPGGRNDIYSPGDQVQGTVTLSKTGVSGDPDYLLIQADQQQCLPTTPGIYCNKRGIIKTQGHVIEVAGDTVTIDGVVIPITGTYVVGNGVNVTKIGTNNYVVNYPSGNTQFVTVGYYTNIYISATSGRQPTGGICTPIVGPNPTTKRALTPFAFCLSWRAPNISDDLFYYSDYLAWRAANPVSFNTSNGNFTTNNLTLFNNALAFCAPLAPNGSLAMQCAGKVPTSPPASVYAACMDDVIATGDYGLAAANIDPFAKKCSLNAAPTVIVLPTSGANSVASGPGLASNIEQSTTPTNFTITARDVNGKTVTTGGDNFVVKFSNAQAFTQTYLGAGVYQVSYTPSVSGAFNISIELNGFAPIINSPFTVDVESTATDPSKSTASGEGVESCDNGEIESGAFVSFVVTARTSSGAPRKTGGDAMAVSITGLASGLQVVDLQNGNYTVTYMQNLEATFTVTVKISGVNIMGSPFTVCVSSDKK